MTAASSSMTVQPVLPDTDSSQPAAASWRAMLVRGFHFLASWTATLTHGIFGFFCLLFLLSIAATLPIVQFLSLGYLIEASGRVIRSGRLRDGFVGIASAARIGSVCLGIFVCTLPVRAISSLWYSSLLLNGLTPQTQWLRVIAYVSAALAAGHIAWGIFRGGRLRHFFLPTPCKFLRRMRQGGVYEEASTRLAAFVDRLRLPHLFALGWRGFLGASVYLFLPVSMMAVAPQIRDQGLGTLLALLGGLGLCCVLVYVPFAQAELSKRRALTDQFRLRQLRAQFKRAPIAHWFALLMTLTLALPLYILKAELIPREAAWLPSLVFVTFMFPARLSVGWAVSRATRREEPRHWLSRWLAWLGLLPISAIYALIVYGTQFTSWYGPSSLYEQHAFLVPVPFLGF